MLQICIKQTSPSVLASQILMMGMEWRMSEIFQTRLWKRCCFKDCFILAADRLTQAILIVAVGWGLVYLRLFSVISRRFCSWHASFLLSLKESVYYVSNSGPPKGGTSWYTSTPSLPQHVTILLFQGISFHPSSIFAIHRFCSFSFHSLLIYFSISF